MSKTTSTTSTTSTTPVSGGTGSKPTTPLAQKAVIPYIIKEYMKALPSSGMVLLFNYLHLVYAQYKKTGNINTLRYLFALAMRARHCWRMPWYSTKLAVDQLLSPNILKGSFSDFEELYKEIKRRFSGIYFAEGPLTIYDTALNLGQLFTPKIEPKKFVYLSAGAWEGAKHLKGRKNISPIMPITDWQTPSLFPGVDSMYIEDILCIFKDIFEKLSKGLPITQTEIDDILKEICCFSPFSEETAISKMDNAQPLKR